MKKEALITLLDEKFDNLVQWLKDRPAEEFVSQKTPGKWSDGEHLEHLRKTSRALNKGMKIPKLVLRYKFGKMNREEKTYEQVVAKYQKALNKGSVKAPAEFVADKISIEDKDRIIKWFREEQATLKDIVMKNSEKALTKYVIPHPLTGRMNFREFIYFTAYHTEHHHKLMKKYNG